MASDGNNNDSSESWITYNLRLPPEMVRKVEQLVMQMNLQVPLEVSGRKRTRADVFRICIAQGAKALEASLPPLPTSEPTTKA